MTFLYVINTSIKPGKDIEEISELLFVVELVSVVFIESFVGIFIETFEIIELFAVVFI